MTSRFATILDTPPIDIDGFRQHPQIHQDEEQPERSRVVDGTEYMTVSEYVRRIDPIFYPVAEDLISTSGYDRTYVQLGKEAADQGRKMGVDPVKMYHPDYGAVNGWPAHILNAAWNKFKMYHRLDWHVRDPEPPSVPQPTAMPAPAVNQRLYEQIRAHAARRGVEYGPAQDPRWRGAMAVMLEARQGETPQQALIRRNSAASVLYAIEMEYERT